ncbi:hypothetical protein N7520_002239 [Penicillium odoratum]|uniref:uncharacterized protein n=1 Tax=Penicillium odoratum TaxID=1167516 RepID=UPI0025470C5E|nr:uncharacterized protein N7520_002239 [Penicillium odoratum]KAJ5771710.1 hypothetical protein N7520_002239 [Penicillium odoratum]
MIQFPQNRRFVGRVKKIDEMKQKLFFQKEISRLAVFGLGGIGKTQVALELAHWVKQNMPSYSIFWMPVLSNASFEQACTQLATKLNISKASDDENAMESVQRHLSLESTGPWLLIIDNADDKELLFGSPDQPGGISQYLPENNRGITLLTTRSREVAVSFAGKDIIKLQEMDIEEATGLLEKTLIQNVSPEDKDQMLQLLKELYCLPLAITQAVAYINTADISISTYFKLLRGTQNDVISLMSRQFHDGTRYKESQNAIATTWVISFQQIQRIDEAAANMLSFISCIEPKGIPQSLLPDLGSEEEKLHAVSTLCGYAFLAKRDEALFDMHSLVHLATQIWVEQEGTTKELMGTAIPHMQAVFPSSDYTNRELWRIILPHGLKIIRTCDQYDSEDIPWLYYKIGHCLKADGRIKEAVDCFEEYCRWTKCRYEEGDPYQLASQHELAGVYQDNGQIGKALKLLEHVVSVRERTLAEGHPDRLASQHELARVYHSDGQIGKALNLLKHVVSVQERTLAEGHQDRLASQHELARVYHSDRQIGKALNLLEHVVAVEERTLAEGHPDRLASQNELAGVYQDNGQIGKALKLLEHVVSVRERTLAEGHPDRLASQHELARVYHSDGQIGKALNLLEHVVAVEERTLAPEHPSRIASQRALARTKQTLGPHSRGSPKF